jgi:hypothetical protein
MGGFGGENFQIWRFVDLEISEALVEGREAVKT